MSNKWNQNPKEMLPWGMLARPDPLKQKRKQQLSDKKPFHSSDSLSNLCSLSPQTLEELDHTFHWNGLSDGRQHLLYFGPGGPPHHSPVQWLQAKRWLCYLHMPYAEQMTASQSQGVQSARAVPQVEHTRSLSRTRLAASNSPTHLSFPTYTNTHLTKCWGNIPGQTT